MGQNQSNNSQLNNNTRTASTSGNNLSSGIIQPCSIESFYDLNQFPPEVGVQILSKLNATDLCLASCVWKDLAENEILWRRLCFSKWGYATIYSNINSSNTDIKLKKPYFKTLYLQLDEASLIFGFRPHQGIKYLIDHNIVVDETEEIAKFIHHTASLSNKTLTKYLKDTYLNSNVLDVLLTYMDFTNLSICDGLRKFFKKIQPPEERGNFMDVLIEKFSFRFVECNPSSELNKEHISVLCYSLMLLSVDLYSPHVKNKMSKREFIRNNYQVLNGEVPRDCLGDCYDDVYLNGHIVAEHHCKQQMTQKGAKRRQHCFPFYRPYGAIFEIKPIEIKLLSCNC